MSEIKLPSGRTLVGYSLVSGRVISDGSTAQMMHFVDDAKKDIDFLAARGRDADKYRALIETLTAALEPFAAVAEHDIGTDETAEDFFAPMERHNRAPRLRVGDLRLARAALDAAKQEMGQ